MLTASAVERAFPRIADLRDERLRRLVMDLWAYVSERNPRWSDIASLPLQPALPIKTYGNLAAHIRAMVRTAESLVPTYAEAWGIRLDLDTFRAAAYIHDAAKVIEFVERDGALVPTPGFNHAIECGKIVRELDGPETIAHMVEAHSFAGPLVVPRTREAQLFLFLDVICLPVFPEQGPSAVERHLKANGWDAPDLLGQRSR
jgi:hypothetical protein